MLTSGQSTLTKGGRIAGAGFHGRKVNVSACQSWAKQSAAVSSRASVVIDFFAAYTAAV